MMDLKPLSVTGCQYVSSVCFAFQICFEFKIVNLFKTLSCSLIDPDLSVKTVPTQRHKYAPTLSSSYFKVSFTTITSLINLEFTHVNLWWE